MTSITMPQSPEKAPVQNRPASGEVWRVSRRDLEYRLWFVVAVLAFRLTLDIAYFKYVEPLFAYSGYVFDPTVAKVIESYLLTFALACIVPCQIKKPSDFLLVVFFFMPVIPTLSFYGLANESRPYMWAMVASFLLVATVRSFPLGGVPYMKHGKAIGLGLAAFSTAIVFAWLIYSGGLGNFNLNLREVYEYRAQAVEQTAQGFFAYLNLWVFKVMNTALLAYAIYRRKSLVVFALILLQVFFFGVSQHKGVFFAPLMVVGVYVLFRTRAPTILFATGLTALALSSMAVAMFFDSMFFASFFVRRIFYTSAKLNFAYYDLFSDLGEVSLSNSIFSGIYEYPFPYPPANLVSHFSLGSLDGSANNGFLATSYMHFGYPGMIVFAIIVGLLVRAVDTLWAGCTPIWLAIALVIIPFMALFRGTDLFTALATHGLLLSLLLLWLVSSGPTGQATGSRT